MNDITPNLYREDSNRIFYTGKPKNYTLVPTREAAISGCSSFKIPFYMRLEARKKARAALYHQSWISKLFNCYSDKSPAPRSIPETIFNLVSYLIENGTETEGIFRREGRKRTTDQIVSEILEFERCRTDSSTNTFDFSQYNALELSSALKYYIREVMNGLFDNMYVAKALAVLIEGNQKDIQLHSKYLLLTLTDEQQKLFLMLKKLFDKVVENKDITKISWQSIYNVFGLTLMPSEAFSTLERIPFILDLFRNVIHTNLDDLSQAIRTLQAK